METTKATGKDLVERWVRQNLGMGKTNEQLIGTTFVYGNELLTIVAGRNGSAVEIESRNGKVVVFRKMDELDLSNTCRACGLEHKSYKETIECCMNMDE